MFTLKNYKKTFDSKICCECCSKRQLVKVCWDDLSVLENENIKLLKVHDNNGKLFHTFSKGNSS
jgi:hypothetical protein